MTMADQATVLRGLIQEHERTRGPIAPTRPSNRLAHSIAVTSGKGGVGKTTVAVNLAVQLASMGRRVILLDADIGTANVDVMCNVVAQNTLAHVVAGRKELQDIVVDAPGGFRLVPGCSGLAHMAELSTHERDRLTAQMRRLESSADVLLIDTGAGVGPNVLSFCLAAERMLVVTTPEPTSITDAYAVIKSVASQGRSIDVRLLVNMVRDEHEARVVFSRVANVCQRFLELSPNYAGYVVSDSHVSRAVRKRRPFVMESPGAKASACLLSLAHRMDRHATDPKPASHGLLKRMATWIAS